ncbi:N-acetylglucosaminylphosphatidylinositoldeacety la se [Gyrodon lividus]|nr:N-acetylglucosaminylphosphatidylinositoldeacety la se [Gyrodon lividus]
MLPLLLTLIAHLVSSLYFPFHTNIQILFDNAGSTNLKPNSSRILLLTAHPDDECFFFGPTILALREDPTYPEIYSLTLSVGNADGLGKIRKEELSRSLDVMGIDQDRRWTIDHPMLQDNISLQWDASVIAAVIAPYVVNNNITTILTFDTQGISSHPNHYSLPFGARYLVDTLGSKAPETLPRIFSLITVPVLAKYTGALSSLHTRLNMLLAWTLAHFTKGEANQRVVLTSGFREYFTTVRAMREHKSQLVWFRHLYMVFSRYMWVNEWVEIKLDTMLERQ